MPGGIGVDAHHLLLVLVPAERAGAGLLGQRTGRLEVVDLQVEVPHHSQARGGPLQSGRTERLIEQRPSGAGQALPVRGAEDGGGEAGGGHSVLQGEQPGAVVVQHRAQPVLAEVEAGERSELLGVGVRDGREVAAQQHLLA